jgi:hypothetical protein
VHSSAYQFVCKMIATYGEPDSVVEIGSYDVNGSVRPLFKKALGGGHYVGIDSRKGPGVDVVCKGESYHPSLEQFPDGVACVVCCEVLEHAPHAKEVVKNAVKMLREGGLLIVTCAMEPRVRHTCDAEFVLTGQDVHEHYKNVDPKEITNWLKSTKLTNLAVSENPALGDLYAWGVK